MIEAPVMTMTLTMRKRCVTPFQTVKGTCQHLLGLEGEFGVAYCVGSREGM